MKNQNLSVRKLARCGMGRSPLRRALHGTAAVFLRRGAGACGRGALPAAGVRCRVHFRRSAGLLPGKPAGSTIVDVIFGTLATLLACLVTYKLRNIRFKGLALAASLPPVVFNAVIIGIEIAVMFPDPSSSAPLWLACVTNGISVGIGELISCTVLGVLLVRIIEASPAVRKVFES